VLDVGWGSSHEGASDEEDEDDDGSVAVELPEVQQECSMQQLNSLPFFQITVCE
jgi:hypothetical protein